MANEKRLIDANALPISKEYCVDEAGFGATFYVVHKNAIDNAPTVGAVEVEDPDLLKAIELLIKQYDHSKASEYVHNPVAHALYHPWKQVDERR